MAGGTQKISLLLPFKTPNQTGWTPSWAHTGRKWAACGGSPALERSATAPFLQLRDDYRGVNVGVNGEDRMQVPSLQQIRCADKVCGVGARCGEGGREVGSWGRRDILLPKVLGSFLMPTARH